MAGKSLWPLVCLSALFHCAFCDLQVTSVGFIVMYYRTFKWRSISSHDSPIQAFCFVLQCWSLKTLPGDFSFIITGRKQRIIIFLWYNVLKEQNREIALDLFLKSHTCISYMYHLWAVNFDLLWMYVGFQQRRGRNKTPFVQWLLWGWAHRQ